jgi:Fic family protein
MFIEIRLQGKRKKYYLVHTYRSQNKVKRISRYLGSDLDKKQLEKQKKRAQELIHESLTEKNIMHYELNADEIEQFKQQGKKIELEHLQTDWERFTKDFTYNTNAIEGSTVTYSEVKELIEKKEIPKDHDEQETLNVSKAVEFTRSSKEKLSLNIIKELHRLCFDKTKEFAGKFRKVEVVIKDKSGNIVHQGAPYNQVETLLNELIVWYQKHKNKYPPLLLAAVVHNQFEKIHPFQDGNGRVGRLLLNFILLRHEYPPVNILLSDRARYYKVLHTFDMTGNVGPTIKFLISQYKKYYN